MVSGMHPSVLFDLQKYHPKAYRALLEKRDAMLLGTVESNIRRGQEEGVYNKNVHPVVAARFLVAISHAVNDLAQENSTGTSVSQLHMQSVHYHIHAISNTTIQWDGHRPTLSPSCHEHVESTRYRCWATITCSPLLPRNGPWLQRDRHRMPAGINGYGYL